MWILYIIAATLLLSLSTVLAKRGGKRADSSITTSLRTLTVVAFMWVFIFANDLQSNISAIDSKAFLYILLTGICLFVSFLCYHISLKKGSVTGVSALQMLTPILIIAVSAFTYSQTSKYYIRIICIALIAAGIILVLTQKSHSGNKNWMFFGILSSIAAVLAYSIGTEGISVSSNILSLTLILSAVLTVSLIAVFIKGLKKGISRIPFGEIMMIVLSGISAGLSWLCFRTAYYTGQASTVFAIISMSVATSAVFATLFLKEKVSWKSVCGLLLIITGMLMYIFMV